MSEPLNWDNDLKTVIDGFPIGVWWDAGTGSWYATLLEDATSVQVSVFLGPKGEADTAERDRVARAVAVASRYLKDNP